LLLRLLDLLATLEFALEDELVLVQVRPLERGVVPTVLEVALGVEAILRVLLLFTFTVL